jgi:polysaccharide export outer membrane protein
VWKHFGTDLDKRTVIHAWLSTDTVVDATSKGYRVIWSVDGKYYLDVFVVSKISNRRVFILGLGQGGSVGGGSGGGSARSTNFDIEHENTTLFEVLSKAGGVGQFSFADRIKVIRGNPSNPTIFTINLTRWNSFQESNMVIQPNDVIYIEPARRKGFELVRDVAQVSVVFTTLITTLLIIRIF